jgi:deferrochelatase/peroxidase EfeB
MAALDLNDIQGIVLRRYPMPVSRNVLLAVRDAAAARAVLGRLASGDEADALQVSSAASPPDSPASAPTMTYRLYVGITWPGLVALEVVDRAPGVSFRSFSAFVEGAADRAAQLGDSGLSAPEHWIDAFGTDEGHVLITLYAPNRQHLDTHSACLDALLASDNAFAELWRGDGEALIEPDENGVPGYVRKAHFGYRDAITEPTVRGGPGPSQPDHQEPCDPWLFVLMDDAPNYYVPDPPELGRNGSFAVFRIEEQDVVGFESFLQSQKDRIDPELLAAKLMGRWRNGVPLALSPDTDSPQGGIAPDKLNEFDYVCADGSGDPWGEHTPIGAHIRRVNPRGQPIKGQSIPGGSNNDHRIIRRALPYGPTYLPSEPYDGIERGLIGHFINTTIENQFEFVLREWMNSADAVGAVRLDPHARDVITGTNDPADSVFEIRQPDGAPPVRITGFRSFTHTRASAYCFLPSITALRFIAGLTCPRDQTGDGMRANGHVA